MTEKEKIRIYCKVFEVSEKDAKKRIKKMRKAVHSDLADDFYFKGLKSLAEEEE